MSCVNDIASLARRSYDTVQAISGGPYYDVEIREPRTFNLASPEILHDADWFREQGDREARVANRKATLIIIVVAALFAVAFYAAT